MTSLQLFKTYGLQSLKKHKFLLLIQAGVSLVLTLIFVLSTTMWNSIGISTEKFINQLAGDSQFVIVSNAPAGISPNLIQQLKDVQGVQNISPTVYGHISVGDHDSFVIGVTEDVKKVSGEWNADIQEVGEHFAIVGEHSFIPQDNNDVLLKSPVDSLAIPQKEIIRFNGDLGKTINKGNFWVVPIHQAAKLLGTSGADTLYVQLDPQANATQVKKSIEEKAGLFGSIMTPNDFAKTYSKNYEMFQSTMLLISIAGLLSGIVLIYVLVTQILIRRRESLSIMRMIGFKKRAIVGAIFIETLAWMLPSVAIGLGLGVLLAESSIQQLPPALTSAFPVYPTYYAEPQVLAVVAALVALPIMISSWIATFKFIRKIDAGIVYMRQTKDTKQSYSRTMALLLAISVLFGGWVAASINSPYETVSLSLFIIAVSSLILSFVIHSALGIFRHWKGIKGYCGVQLSRAITTRISLFFIVILSVALPFSIMGAVANLVEAGDDTVISLKNNDFYLQSGPADALPIAPVMRLEDITKLQELPSVKKALPGKLSPFKMGDHAYTLQSVSKGTQMPAAYNAGKEAVDSLFTGNHVILSRKASHFLNLKKGDSIDLPGINGIHTFLITGISDYISINDGQIVLSHENLCKYLGQCEPSYVEVDAANNLSEARQAITSFMDTIGVSKAYLNDGYDEYLALSQSISSTAILSYILLTNIIFMILLGLFATVFSDTDHRRKELSTLIAVGYTPMQVRTAVSSEYVFTILLAIGIGIVTGLLWLSGMAGSLEQTMFIHVPSAVNTSGPWGFTLFILCAALVAVWVGTRTLRSDPALLLRLQR